MTWEKIWNFIKSGRLGEPSTYAGIGILVVTFYQMIGKSLIDPATQEALTGLGLATYLATPLALVLPLIMGISGLIAIFRREGQTKPPE
jgi:hypothetical protein